MGSSIFALADLACAMPWEDKAPISVRLDFKDAVTPELFVELVQALRGVVAVADRETDEFIRARAAIAKALGTQGGLNGSPGRESTRPDQPKLPESVGIGVSSIVLGAEGEQ